MRDGLQNFSFLCTGTNLTGCLIIQKLVHISERQGGCSATEGEDTVQHDMTLLRIPLPAASRSGGSPQWSDSFSGAPCVCSTLVKGMSCRDVIN